MASCTLQFRYNLTKISFQGGHFNYLIIFNYKRRKKTKNKYDVLNIILSAHIALINMFDETIPINLHYMREVEDTKGEIIIRYRHYKFK